MNWIKDLMESCGNLCTKTDRICAENDLESWVLGLRFAYDLNT